MFLAEKGLMPKSLDISIANGEQFGTEFRSVNPRGTLPVLITDAGTVLTENLGIAAYLEAYKPDPPLMGRNADEKGLVLMWNAIAEQQGGMPIAEALRNSHPAFQDRALPGPVNHAQLPDLAERGFTRVRGFFDLLEERLSQSPYLAGERFSLADITAFVFVEFARVIKMRLPEEHANARAWHASVQERPSASL
ncbi:glutathione S-transferase, putative [Roseobacter sp. SK209-2-6]|nr:glutathione S-transferase, putative [Roseobacter sp. SK209-2-6]